MALETSVMSNLGTLSNVVSNSRSPHNTAYSGCIELKGTREIFNASKVQYTGWNINAL